MRIYKISQQQQPIDQEAMQEVAEAINRVNQSVAIMNQSIQVIEQTGVANLFQKDSLIQAIQSGDLSKLDPTKVEQALQAMQNIAQASPILNNAMAVVRDNQRASQMLKMDFTAVQNMIINSLQSGDYSQFQSTMSNFQSTLNGLSATTGF